MSEIRDPTRIPGQRDSTPGNRTPSTDAQPATARPRPARGLRPLTAVEQVQRQRALACVAADKETATAGCSDTLDYVVFFDGTNNNREMEMRKPVERRALSNISKLFDAHQSGDRYRRLVRYIAGVGTPFAEVGDSGGMLGSMIGKGSEPRIRWALDELDRAIHRFPSGVKVSLITVSAFGFSRGAASARAFVRDLASRCKQEGGRYLYQGIPLRIAFLGIFDTVCSAYDSVAQAAVSGNGGHNGWAHDMRLPGMVEQSLHLTAGHEARIRFPLDSVRDGVAYPGNVREVSYPGMHADVGGGYAPGEQGRYNTLSRFALNEMYQVARAGGTRLRDMGEVRPEVRDEFDDKDPELRAAFNAYVQALGRNSATLEQFQDAHMELLHRWLKVRAPGVEATEAMRSLDAQREQVQRSMNQARARLEAFVRRHGPAGLGASVEEKAQRERDQQTLRDGYEDLRELSDQRSDLEQEDSKVVSDIAILRRRRARGSKLSHAESIMLKAWDNPAPLPEEVKRFFDLFTHDSVAHFDYDSSRLTTWRTMFFGSSKYSPT